MNLDRRTVLKGTLGGSLLMALGAAGVSLQPSASVSAPALKCLSARDYAILKAIAEALIDVPDGLPSVEESGCLLRIDALMDAIHPGDAAEFKQALALMENPLLGLVDGRIRPLSMLAPEARRAVLRRWQTSRMPLRRTAMRAVHGLLTSNYWADRRTHTYLGYEGPQPWLSAVQHAGANDAG